MKTKNKSLEKARQELGRKTKYEVEIEDSVMSLIEKEWAPILTKHKIVFSPSVAIHAIVRAEANRSLRRKIFGK